MAPESCAQQSPCNNPWANLTREQNELASPQSPAKRSDVGSDKAPTPSEAPTPLFVPPIKDFFAKFMKAFVKLTQTWDWKQTDP